MKIQSNKYSGKNRGQKSSNVIEAFKDLGSSATTSLKDDLLARMPGDFMDQLFGPQTNKTSGELHPGSYTEISPVSKENSMEAKIRTQISFERSLFQEERIFVQKRTNELKMQLKMLTDEVLQLAKSTQNLSGEIQTASMQATIEPGIYHIVFFERIVEFIRSFRGKIDDATLWMGSANKRAEKKNYWSKYKKHGGKFLLSADHYVSRSAG